MDILLILKLSPCCDYCFLPFCVVPLCLNFMCGCFGTLSLFHIHRSCKEDEDETESSKTLAHKNSEAGE
jgi:hypothetical protein